MAIFPLGNLVPTGQLLPMSGGSIGLGIPGIPMRINVDYFFDRAAVRGAMSDARYWALYRAGSVVMQIARRSIRRMGLARPRLRIMEENPGVPLRTLMADPNTPRRTRNRLAQRLYEIQARPPSAPGTPPHTHTGIFRRGITYDYDRSSESVVIGQTLEGGNWLAALHEFGGYQRMQGWAWIPRYPRYTRGIIMWQREGRAPRNTGRWAPTNMRQTMTYPERPYMLPAMERAVASGRIAQEFAGRFRRGGL